MAFPHNIWAAQMTQFYIEFSIAKYGKARIETHDLCPPQIGSSETLKKACIFCLCHLQLGCVSDIRQRGIDFSLMVWRILT
jgi:hypothetical protein